MRLDGGTCEHNEDHDLLARRRPPPVRLVSRYVLIPAPGETPGEWWDNNTGSLAAREAAPEQGG